MVGECKWSAGSSRRGSNDGSGVVGGGGVVVVVVVVLYVWRRPGGSALSVCSFVSVGNKYLMVGTAPPYIYMRQGASFSHSI